MRCLADLVVREEYQFSDAFDMRPSLKGARRPRPLCTARAPGRASILPLDCIAANATYFTRLHSTISRPSWLRDGQSGHATQSGNGGRPAKLGAGSPTNPERFDRAPMLRRQLRVCGHQNTNKWTRTPSVVLSYAEYDSLAQELRCAHALMVSARLSSLLCKGGNPVQPVRHQCSPDSFVI